jgi:hypothetical protein
MVIDIRTRKPLPALSERTIDLRGRAAEFCRCAAELREFARRITETGRIECSQPQS